MTQLHDLFRYSDMCEFPLVSRCIVSHDLLLGTISLIRQVGVMLVGMGGNNGW